MRITTKYSHNTRITVHLTPCVYVIKVCERSWPDCIPQQTRLTKKENTRTSKKVGDVFSRLCQIHTLKKRRMGRPGRI